MQRRASGYTGQRMLKVELAGRRKRGRRCGVGKEGSQRVGVREEDAKEKGGRRTR